jgi:hypothetical protein
MVNSAVASGIYTINTSSTSIADDRFDGSAYSTGSFTLPQNPTVGCDGFNGNWAGYVTATGAEIRSGGLTDATHYPNPPATDVKLRINRQNGVYVYRPFTNVPSAQTYYFSFLLGSPGYSSEARFGIAQASPVAKNEPNGVLLGLSLYTLSLKYKNTSGTASSVNIGSLSSTGTYYVLVTIDMGTTASGDETITAEAINVATGVSVGSVTRTGTVLASDLQTFYASCNWNSTSGCGNGDSYAVSLDEFKFGVSEW